MNKLTIKITKIYQIVSFSEFQVQAAMLSQRNFSCAEQLEYT